MLGEVLVILKNNNVARAPMAKAVELPFFIHGEALYGRASEELFIGGYCSSLDCLTKYSMVTSIIRKFCCEQLINATPVLKLMSRHKSAPNGVAQALRAISLRVYMVYSHLLNALHRECTTGLEFINIETIGCMIIVGYANQ